MEKITAPKMVLPKGKKVTIVAARFNDFITNRLVEGAVGKLKEFNLDDKNISVIWVPGSLEIPVTVKKVIAKRKPDAVIAAGAVIRGETDHYNFVAAESSKGIAQVSLESEIPVINAILTCDNLDQAINRAGAKAGNKGVEAAMAVVEMLSVFEQL